MYIYICVYGQVLGSYEKTAFVCGYNNLAKTTCTVYCRRSHPKNGKAIMEEYVKRAGFSWPTYTTVIINAVLFLFQLKVFYNFESYIISKDTF